MLTLQLSPLQLEGYYIREFFFSVRPGLEEEAKIVMQNGLHMQGETLFDPDIITLNMVVGGEQHPEDPTRWASIIELSTKNAPEIKFPYDFRIVLVGFFTLNLPQATEITAEAEKALKINATSMLYSAAREFIAGATGRGLFPAAILPSVVIRFSEESEGTQMLAKKSLPIPRSSTKKAAKKSRSKKKRK